MDPKVFKRELKVLEKFIEVYCRSRHSSESALCPECNSLMEYARGRLEHCPYDPKPACKNCPTHCYKPEMRKKIKEVMRFSGVYFIKRGRLDWLVRYFI